MKHLFTEAIVVLVDELCIRCDRKHTGACSVSEKDWHESERCRRIRDFSPERIVEYVRYDRVQKVLGK